MPLIYGEYLSGSDGVGEAVRANVVVARDVGSSQINVDTVLNWPQKFIATSGTIDTLTGTFDTDTVTVFYGHLSGSYIEIDEYAPGYSDIGNAMNEIVVIKPTTPWADKVSESLDEMPSVYVDATAPTSPGDGDLWYDTDADTPLTVALKMMNPIGTVYTNTSDPTNPATLFGFGTWVAVEGRTVVGKAPSGTFSTAGDTMGEETHTLTGAEMPTHNHSLPNGGTGGASNPGQYVGAQWSNSAPGVTGNSGGTGSKGGGGSHNNIQPTIVAYVWERVS